MFARFVGMQSDEKLWLIYVRATYSIKIIRFIDFELIFYEGLPDVAANLDGSSPTSFYESFKKN